MAKFSRFYKLLQFNIKSYSHFAVELFLFVIIALTAGVNLYLRTNLGRAQTPNKSLFFVYLKNYVPDRNEKLVDAYESVRIKLTQDLAKPASPAGRQILAASTIEKQIKSNNPKDVPLPTLSGSALLKPNPPSSDLFITKRDVEGQKYEIKPGDSVGAIADAFNVSVDTIKWENNMSTANPVIKPGEILTILPTNGVKHVIKEGETISGLAKKYGVDAESIFEYNEIEIEELIIAGEEIIIPNGIKTAPPTRERQQYLADLNKNDYKKIEVPADFQGSGSGLIWPLPAGHRISQYASRKHMAIDLPCRDCQVTAAGDGIVEQAGWKTGYGNMVMINHGNGLKTLYAHGKELLVNAGDSVAQGQSIMISGSTGRSTGPHLHFEVRVNGALQNPLSFVNP